VSQGLENWVIYERPKDHPENFVVRRWTIGAGVVVPDKECVLADTLEEARSHVPKGLVRFPRQSNQWDYIPSLGSVMEVCQRLLKEAGHA